VFMRAKIGVGITATSGLTKIVGKLDKNRPDLILLAFVLIWPAKTTRERQMGSRRPLARWRRLSRTRFT